METATQKGRTIAGWVYDKFFGDGTGGKEPPALDAPKRFNDGGLSNPLKLSISTPENPRYLRIDLPAYMDRIFELTQIAELYRTVGHKRLPPIVDYELTAPESGDDGELCMVLRVLMQADGSFEHIILEVAGSQGYAKNPETGIDGRRIELDADEGKPPGVEENAAYQLLSKYENVSGRLYKKSGGREQFNLTYWDFAHLMKEGETAKDEYYVLEMDTTPDGDDRGQFTGYRGFPCSSSRVKPVTGHEIKSST